MNFGNTLRRVAFPRVHGNLIRCGVSPTLTCSNLSSHGCLFAVPPSVCCQHLLPYPVSDDHDRAGVGSPLFQAPVSAIRRCEVDGPLFLLHEDLRPDFQPWSSDWSDHVIPVRHQLAGLHEHCGQHRGSLVSLRSADGVFPRGNVFGNHAVCVSPGSCLVAHSGDVSGCGRNNAFRFLDSCAQQLDADPCRF
ncbi:MAG: hypothetical protein BWY82_02388 [Verrucomicrobia bacterium ADurb.Bin474]|nr:MAG: hypothetical protein BWY82_02388 [Verrucomicrobia bacterium ADurb.Bin474]